MASAFIAGVGGTLFVFLKGTIGGTWMSVGFSMSGILVAYAAAKTYLHARAHQFEQHRAWAIWLFALVVGSWLYRMEYNIWLRLLHGAGHGHHYSGLFDHVMDFFFYVPNLILAELFIRGKAVPTAQWSRRRPR